MKREGRTISIPSRKTVNGRPLVVAVSPAMVIARQWFVFAVFVCLCKAYCTPYLLNYIRCKIMKKVCGHMYLPTPGLLLAYKKHTVASLRCVNRQSVC